MDNSIKKEKFRKLSIVALVTGILSFAWIPFTHCEEIALILSEKCIVVLGYFFDFYIICLSAAAIVCGIIDLKRIKAGLYSKKGKGLDMAGIVLGGAMIFLFLFVLVFNWLVYG